MICSVWEACRYMQTYKGIFILRSAFKLKIPGYACSKLHFSLQLQIPTLAHIWGKKKNIWHSQAFRSRPIFQLQFILHYCINSMQRLSYKFPFIIYFCTTYLTKRRIFSWRGISVLINNYINKPFKLFLVLENGGRKLL